MLNSWKSYWSGSTSSETAESSRESTVGTAPADDSMLKSSGDGAGAASNAQTTPGDSAKWSMSMSMDSAMLSNVLKPDEVRQTFSKARNFFGKIGSVALQKTTQILEENTPILGEFSREQNKFEMEKQRREAIQQQNSVLPWLGYANEDAIKKQILALSLDKRNFMRNPPGGSQFVFDINEYAGAAKVMLEVDPNLSKMRFELVPKVVREDAFWRNYFYRVSLIKQSAQLAELATTNSQSPHRTPVGSDNPSDSTTSEAVTSKQGTAGASVSHGASDEIVTEASHATELDMCNEEPDGGDFVSESLAQTVTLSNDELAQLKLSGNTHGGTSAEASDATKRSDADAKLRRANESETRGSKKADDATSGSDWSHDEFELVADAGAATAQSGASAESESIDDELEREILAEIALEEAQSK